MGKHDKHHCHREHHHSYAPHPYSPCAQGVCGVAIYSYDNLPNGTLHIRYDRRTITTVTREIPAKVPGGPTHFFAFQSFRGIDQYGVTHHILNKVNGIKNSGTNVPFESTEDFTVYGFNNRGENITLAKKGLHTRTDGQGKTLRGKYLLIRPEDSQMSLTIVDDHTGILAIKV